MRLGRVLYRLFLAIILAMLAITIPAASVMAAAGTISTPSPSSGPEGTVVGITGSGFSAGSTYTVLFAGSAVTTDPVSGTGTFTASFSVPAAPHGAKNVTVTTTGPDTSNTVTFTVTQQMALGSNYGAVGDEVLISGTGFTASSTIAIYFDGSSVGSATTDTSGSFLYATIIVPQTTYGSHSMTATDAIGISYSTTFTVGPTVTMSTGTVTVGQSVAIRGTGFAASSGITFYIDGSAVSTTASTNPNGTFTVSGFTIPSLSRGSHTLRAVDDSSNQTSVGFTVSQSITLNPTTSVASAAIRVTGNGFGSIKTVNISFNAVSVTTSPSIVTSDSNGNFVATFILPSVASGVYVVSISDGTYSATANITVVASASLSQISGTVNTEVTVSGTGFAPNGAVTLRYVSIEIGGTTTDGSGVFSFTFKAPVSASGNHTVVVTDTNNTVPLTFTIQASASLNPASGYVGDSIIVAGTGFIANSPVVVKYDAQQVATGITDATGSFTVTFRAPASKGGNHTIVATDSISAVSMNFAMDTTPPPTPIPSEPANGTGANAQTNFIWSEVSDPSGVTYDLQVATDAAFSNIILQKTGLTSPVYTITEQEKLKSVSRRSPYYWRVKAIDLASNESPWSTPFSFHVGFELPTWALYTIFGIAVLLAGLLGFYFGLRRAKVP